MNAELFVLAVVAALNPKLLALDLMVIENQRPRAMFLCLLLAGMMVALTIGLLDVLIVHADVITAQGKASAGVDLALGLMLLAGGGLLASGRPRRLHRPAAPARAVRPDKPEKAGWTARLLAEPRLGLAMLVGALIGLPGASYITALHNLVAGKYSTTADAVAVAVFVVIEFLLIIVPFAFLEFWPEGTKAILKRGQDWLLGHALQLIVGIALILGAYLTVSGLVRLS
jgi:hypothetical protein